MSRGRSRGELSVAVLCCVLAGCSSDQNGTSPEAVAGNAGSSSPAGTAGVSGTVGQAGSFSSAGMTNGGSTSGAASAGASGSSGSSVGGMTQGGAGTAGEVGHAGASGSGGAGGTGGKIDTSGPPFTVTNGLFDQTKTDDLGLPVATGTETLTIFRPTDKSDHYSNGVVLVAFQGWLYAQWQSSPTDEDTPDTWTAYSRSQDGKSWSAPMTLAAANNEGRHTSGGWWVSGSTLVAYVNVWPTTLSPEGGYTTYVTSTDGLQWSSPKKLLMADGTPLNAVFEQDPHALPDGRIVNAAHFQPGVQAAPVYTDDASGVSGWKRAPFQSLAATAASTRELEPSSYLRTDGAVVMIFRDQNSTFHKLAALSADRGQTWTKPVETNMPDSRAKQSAGNLPDGTAYFASNPVLSKTRIPLAVTLGHDGKLFDKAFVLRKGGSDLQAQRYSGTSKGLGYSYPKSMVANGYLYVGYATNKEDVQCTRVPLTSLSY